MRSFETNRPSTGPSTLGGRRSSIKTLQCEARPRSISSNRERSDRSASTPPLLLPTLLRTMLKEPSLTVPPGPGDATATLSSYPHTTPPMRHPDYQDISRRFRQHGDWIDEQPLEFPADNADLYNLLFSSRGACHLIGQEQYVCPEHNMQFPGEPARQSPPDHAVKENSAFRYPLVREHAAPAARKRYSRATVILHGLNERSFTKYIPWAYHLWDRTRTPIILFPLPFHINRVYPAWLFL